MNSYWTALNTTEFSYQIWSCPIFLLKPKRADWLMCFRLLRWIFMSLFWLVCRNLMGSYEFVLWWCGDTLESRWPCIKLVFKLVCNVFLVSFVPCCCVRARSQIPVLGLTGRARDSPALWNSPAPPYSRRNTVRQKGSAWRMLPTFEH